MAMICLSLPPLFPITKPKPSQSCLLTHNLSLPFISLSPPLRPKTTIHFHKIHQRKKTLIWRIYAAPEEALPLDTAPVESNQQIVYTGDDGSSNIISILLFIAFIILSILTVGVIYLGVTDFLEKREKEKLEKEEEAKKKKDGKKRKVRARTGPRGFGQKINEDDDLID
ncbi:hypothetical protein JCGZ_02953 [Jatropha curcas]|uniref:Transmembrane protein n=1 Tax=Jatropha curcas TaxID=180498 RepID=A0A067L4W0_JATCU|nr:uncharacterized protein LOC105629931 [Jatropha curcas]KDP42223.1 hypothetical protein JCGZ_02953 [Jatropha curcas]